MVVFIKRKIMNKRLIKISFGFLAVMCILLEMNRIFPKGLFYYESQPQNNYNVIIDLEELAKMIYQANIHVRGSKTSNLLKKASLKMQEVFRKLNLNYANVTKRKTFKVKSVCDEKYLGTKYGFPRYYKGFVMENCAYSKPLHSLITFVISVKYRNSNAEILLNSIQKNFKNVKVFINLNYFYKNTKKHKSVMYFKENGTEGYILNKMLKHVKTPYVLIAHHVMWFNSDARIERLIHQIEKLGTPAAAGAYRNSSGYWFVGCQQSVLRNYTLVYEAGYDESAGGCQICDHIDGPFVINSTIVKSLQFDERLHEEGLFEDFFLRLKSEIAVCPDSMFFTYRQERSLNSQSWNDFAKKWDLVMIKLSGERIFIQKPENYSCNKTTNGIPSSYCLIELHDLVKNVMSSCIKNNIWCELESGTTLGAVKLNSILPWEVDADIIYMFSNASAMAEIGTTLRKIGYKFSNQSTANDYIVYSRNWFCEIWVINPDPIEDFVPAPKYKTKVNINGEWYPTIRNPGLYLYNRYGKEIFQHAQSWRATKDKDCWINYKTNKFLKCGNPGKPSCLDQYNADGNIQFQDPIP